MKKFIVACAVVLSAGLFASCGDTNYCYEITATAEVPIVGTITQTSYSWCTSNEIKAAEADLKTALVNMGASEDAIKLSSKRTNKSQADCHK